MTRKKRDDTALLKQIRDDYRRFMEYWRENWAEGDRDMEALSIYGPWPEAERKARSNPESLRPCEHFDIIFQYSNRVVNQAALNPVGVKVNPVGEDGTEETAQLREKRLRQIAFDSKAAQARLTAFQSAVERGIGHWIVRVEFVERGSFNQRIVIERIQNPKSVLIDPNCKKADRSDMKKAFFIDRMSWDGFRREYPRAQYKSFDHEAMAGCGEWASKDNGIMVGEYWSVEETPRRLLLVDQLGKIFEDELMERFPDAQVDDESVTLTPGGAALRILKSRDSEKCEG